MLVNLLTNRFSWTLVRRRAGLVGLVLLLVGVLLSVTGCAGESADSRAARSTPRLGYPPAHRTPSLDANEWYYWRNRWKQFVVVFDGNTVLRVAEE